jgi:hypothetical protein
MLRFYSELVLHLGGSQVLKTWPLPALFLEFFPAALLISLLEIIEMLPGESVTPEGLRDWHALNKCLSLDYDCHDG